MTQGARDVTVSSVSRSLDMPPRYTVVSIDGHVGPSMREHLRAYCESGHLRAFDAFVEAAEAHDVLVRTAETNEFYLERRRHHASVDGLSDPSARLRDLDADGVAAEVLYHGGLNGQSIPFTTTTMFSWSSAEFTALEPVGVRIYNRWLADFVSEAPHRFVGIAHIPVPDVAACVEEVEWARSAGLRAVNLPAPRRDLPHYNDPYWEPLWSVCEDHHMVLCTHGGAGDTPRYSGPEAAALGLVESAFFGRRAVWVLIFGGVFERHPHLRYVTTEQFGDWVPETLLDMDSAYECYIAANLSDVLPERPSTYWMRNCFIGASFLSRREAHLAVERQLTEKFMWGSDYPHPEGTWPRTQASLRMTFSALNEEYVRQMLGENAIGVYELDRSTLKRVSDHIGPTVDELAVPLIEPPEQFVGLAFRTKGKFS